MRRRTRAILGLLAALALPACEGLVGRGAVQARATDLPNRGLARLVGMTQVTFATQLAPVCKLQTAAGFAFPDAWMDLSPEMLAGKTADVTDVRLHRNPAGHVDFVALALRETPQSTRWVRNVPAADADDAALAWRCAVDPAERTRLAPHLVARRVRLSLGSSWCSGMTPVLGGAGDVTILPYDVRDEMLLAASTLSPAEARDGATGAFVAVQLRESRGNGSLTVRADDFDRCFVPVLQDAAPEVWDDALRLSQWLAALPPDPRLAPPASLQALQLATGFDPSRCEHDGDGPAEHLACAIPSLRAEPLGTTAGGTALALVRERSTDAIDVYGGKVIPHTDAAAYDLVVRPHVGGGLAARMAQSFDASVLDPAKQLSRAELGYRLLRPADLGPAALGAHVLDVEVTYKVVRRHGTAQVRATIRSPDGSVEMTSAPEVPFEAEDALAGAVVERLDDVARQWVMQTHLAPAAPASLQPGSRAWALAVARRAVGDRPVALLSDWLENRAAELQQSTVTIPVELPAGSESRCFVYTAVALDRDGDANLVFGSLPTQGRGFAPIGRDMRPDRDAAVELCNVAPGQYALAGWTGRPDARSGFLFSVFESTPGIVRDEDLRAGMAGAPRPPAAGERPALIVPARR